MIYPQYWLGLHFEITFLLHLNMIKIIYCVLMFIVVVWRQGPMLDPISYDMQHSLFVLTMKTNSKHAMDQPCSTCNHLIGVID